MRVCVAFWVLLVGSAAIQRSWRKRLVLGVCVIDVLCARGGGEGAVVTNPTKQQQTRARA